LFVNIFKYDAIHNTYQNMFKAHSYAKYPSDLEGGLAIIRF